MPIQPDPILKPSARIRLSWKSYYEQFKALHGQPVLWMKDDAIYSNGLLLFQDGWTYSTESYAGPEYPPPPKESEDLRRLKVIYWTLKLGVLRSMRAGVDRQLTSLRSLQASRAMPLRYTIPRGNGVQSSEDGTVKADADKLDLTAMGARLDLIDLDIEDCKAKLEELKPKPTENSP
jgi:hypothetical protein